ncbi:MAG TPA: hypothetical protein DCS93_28470 [Microscillaceae bacterium]|nr:hypothetical protein [Microscillaceae bacterium]
MSGTDYELIIMANQNSSSQKPVDQDKILDGLYRSRDILINNIKELTLQIRQFNIGAVLFLIVFTALIFNENFKPSSWQKAHDTLLNWKKTHGGKIKFLSSVTYRHFQQSNDSTFFSNRKAILKSIKGKVSPTNAISFYQNRLNKGFVVSDIAVLKNELDSLYKTQHQIEQYQAERENAKQLLDSLQRLAIIENDTLANIGRLQTIADLRQTLPEYIKQFTEDSTFLQNRFARLKDKYPKINLLLVNDALASRKKIDTIQATLKKFEEDKEVMLWQDMKSSHPHALTWSYKTWQVLSNSKVVADWKRIFQNLNFEDSLEVMKKVKLDSSFVFNQANVRAFTENQRKNKQKVPTTEFFGTKIPLPTKQILIILPILLMALVLSLQVLHLQKRTAEIRMVRVEQRIQAILHNEELVCSNIFGKEVMDGTPNIALLRKFKFKRLFANNADNYRDIIFNFANIALFIFMANKWSALIANDPKSRFWAVLVLLLGIVGFTVVYIINLNMTKQVLADVRGDDREETASVE